MPQPPKPNKKLLTRLATQRTEDIKEILSCGSADEQKDLLTALCPCRNRRYDVEVWRAIYNASREGETGAVRDQAQHAIGTLLERSRTDPRSQELLGKLIAEGDAPESAGEHIPQWMPNLRGGGLYIPRFEKSARSKSNRRK